MKAPGVLGGLFGIALAALLLTIAPHARADEVAPVADPARFFPVRIHEIRIRGLVRTKEAVVRRELGFREGEVVTKADFDFAVTRLWNMTIFAHVHGHVFVDNGHNVAIFELEDRWTLNPLLRFAFGGDAFFFRVGAIDNNIAGRFIEAAAQYEYFDGFHGGQALFREPRLGGTRLELFTQIDRLVRPRPGFADQRSQLILEVAALTDRDRIRGSLRASGFSSRFLRPVEGPAFFPAPTESLLFEPGLRVGRVDTVRMRQRGASLDVRPGVGFTNSDVASEYVSLTGEALAFAMLGERWNLAARIRAANVTQVPAHLELFAGGLDYVRGFPDNYVRTRAYALANLEARLVAFDSTWLALLPTAFADVIAARAPAGVIGTAMSVGAGVRFIVPKFVASGLRADVAIPVHTDLRAVGEAEQSRFGPATPAPDLGSLQPSFGVYQYF